MVVECFQASLVSLNGRLVPGLHAMVHGLPQKLECQGIQVLVDVQDS